MEYQKLHGLPLSGDEWLGVPPNDPLCWQWTTIIDAGVSAGAPNPKTLYQWMRDGTMATPEVWERAGGIGNRGLHNTYRINMRKLRQIVTMTGAERKLLRGFKSKRGQKYEAMEALKETGWEPGTKMVLSQNEIAVLFGLDPSTVSVMVHTGYFYAPLDYKVLGRKHGYEVKEWDLDAAEKTVELWKRRHRGKPGAGGWNPRKTRRERDLAAVADFEQGYKPPAERQDTSDTWAIEIQERAEKQTALLLGNRRMSPRPYSVPVQNRRHRKPKNPRATNQESNPDSGDMYSETAA
jgi:hypothetical protein